MKKNIGTKDRISRFIFGIICIALIFIVPDHLLVIKILLGILGFFGLFQAFMSWCLFYQLTGRNSCPIE